jgi:hypothetical protein
VTTRQPDAIVDLVQTRVVELEKWHVGEVIGLANPRVGDQRVGVDERRTPAVKPDRPLEFDDHLATQRVAILRRIRQARQPIPTV